MGLENQVKTSQLKWSVAGKFVTQIINWVITIFVMGLLTPDDYGLIGICNVFNRHASALFTALVLILF